MATVRKQQSARSVSDGMDFCQTRIAPGGLMRCCLDTIDTLEVKKYEDEIVIDCKYEVPGNEKIVLRQGIWQFNQKE